MKCFLFQQLRSFRHSSHWHSTFLPKRVRSAASSTILILFYGFFDRIHTRISLENLYSVLPAPFNVAEELHDSLIALLCPKNASFVALLVAGFLAILTLLSFFHNETFNIQNALDTCMIFPSYLTCFHGTILPDSDVLLKLKCLPSLDNLEQQHFVKGNSDKIYGWRQLCNMLRKYHFTRKDFNLGYVCLLYFLYYYTKGNYYYCPWYPVAFCCQKCQ